MKKVLELRPSASERWIACPGSAYLKSRYDLDGGPSSFAALEGTRAHEVAAEALQKALAATDYRVTVGDAKEDEDAQEVEIDQAMIDHARWYAEVLTMLFDLYKVREVSIECKLDWSEKLKGDRNFSRAENGGTADATAIGSDVLIVADYKYGKGKEVEARGNKQLLNYAILKMESLPRKWQPDLVLLVIAQPRIAHDLKVWALPWDEFAAHRDQFEADRSRAITAQDGVFRIGPHCHWCEASGSHCKAQAEQSLAAAQVAFGKVAPKFSELSGLTPEKVAFILQNEKAIRVFLDDVKKHATRLALEGAEFPGFKLVQSLGDRRWIDPEGLPAKLRRKIMGEPKILSPAQAEKIVGKGVLDEYIFRPELGGQLAPLSDKRADYDPSRAAKEVFSPVGD